MSRIRLSKPPARRGPYWVLIRVLISSGTVLFALSALAASWIGINIYRIDHAIHRVSVPASLLARGHADLLVIVKGPDHSEQVLVIHSAGAHTAVLTIPNTLALPVSNGATAPLDSLSIRRPAAIISGLDHLGLPIGRFVGVDLHMFSSKSEVGQFATGQLSASSLVSNPVGASSLLEQVASHVYLGPGTPMSAVLSLTALSATQTTVLPTTRAPRGGTVLADVDGSVLRSLE